MKNLAVQSIKCSNALLQSSSGLDSDCIQHFGLSGAGDGLLYCATKSGLVMCIGPDGKQIRDIQVPWSHRIKWQAALYPEQQEGSPWQDSIVAFDYVLELDALLIVLSGGDLLLLHVEGPEAEDIGTIQGGVAAASWSPDGELVALLSRTGNLILMNKEWEPVSEIPLPPPSSTSSSSSSEGSGSPALIQQAEIKWRGDGKFFSTSCCYQAHSSSSSSTAHQLLVWERDGCQLHATCQGPEAEGLSGPTCWLPNSRHLYAAAATPAATPAAAPPAAGKGAAAAANPAVPPAAGAQEQQQQQQQSPVRQRVQLFERNGLPHGHFDLSGPADSATSSSSGATSLTHVCQFSRSGLMPSGVLGWATGDLVVHQMLFSPDSEVLAIVLAPKGWQQHQQQQQAQLLRRQQQQQQMQQEGAAAGPPAAAAVAAEGEKDPSPDESGPWQVQLWHRSNWHWYLKQVLLFEAPGPSGIHAAWEEGAGQLLHVMTSWGQYCRLGWGWQYNVSGRGTAAVVDGRAVLLTPLRLGLVPPPMSAVTALLPHPASLLAWWDGDIARDFAGPAAGPAGAGAGAGEEKEVPAEVLAVLMSNGQLAFLRAAESDLWEEALEDQQAAGVSGDVLLPLGLAASPATTTSGDGSSSSSSSSSRGGGGRGLAEPEIPLAEGRRVKSMVWLGPDRLLLVAAPFPEEGFETGEGDVLLEVTVQLPPPPLPAGDSPVPAAAAAAAAPVQQQQQPVVSLVSCSYAGGSVLKAVTAAAGAAGAGEALVQLTSGALLCYSSGSGGLVAAGPAADFPCGCPTMLILPTAVAAAGGGAPALGLSPAGLLYWGRQQLAHEVTSASLRGGGPGGPALVYTTRNNLMYTVLLRELRTYLHQTPDGSKEALSWRRSEYPGDLRAAMAAAMRPNSVAAAARDVHVRAVEQGARLLAAPWGKAEVVLQMQRGNLEGVTPRLLVLIGVLEALEAGEYGQAWQQTSSQRLDLNCVVDYCWPRFLQQVGAFVKGVHKPSDLCDLLFALKNGSTLQPGGLYDSLVAAAGLPAEATAAPPGPAAAATATAAGTGMGPAGAAGASSVAGSSGADSSSSSSKVTLVCDAVREAVQQLPGAAEGSYLKVVVTAYMRSDPPNLEAALVAIRDAKEAGVSGCGSPDAAAAAAAAHGLAGSSSSSSIASGEELAASSPSPALAAAVAGAAGQLNGAAAGAAAAGAAAAGAAAAGAAAAGAAAAGAAAAGGQPVVAEHLSSAADAALRHMLLYIDPDQLYQVALGLYDLPLAFMVISQAQKDPGEYLQELSGFGAVADENLRKYQIDAHLGRFSRALEHLVAAGPGHFAAALKLARERGLLRQLLHLQQKEAEAAAAAAAAAAAVAAGAAPQQQQQGGGVAAGVLPAAERVKAVLAAYGDWLLDQRRAEDAAVAYSAAGEMEQALKAYKEAGLWRMALVVAHRLSWSAEALQQLAADMVEPLQMGGQGAEAAVLLVEVLGDVDGGVAALVAAKEWREALRVAATRSRGDLVDTVVLPAAAQGAAALLADATEATSKIAKYLGRLQEVRAKRLAMAAAVAAADAEAVAMGLERSGLQPEDDLVSEAPSMVSGFSMYTDRTTTGGTLAGGSSAASSRVPSTVGGRRALRSDKKAAKRGRIKQGSPAEEAGLVGHIMSLGPGGHVLEEAGQLAELLCLVGHLDDAQKLQQAVAEWQQAYDAAAQDVRDNPLPAAAAQAAGMGPAAAAGAAAGGAGAAAGKGQGTGANAGSQALADVRWKWDILRP